MAGTAWSEAELADVVRLDWPEFRQKYPSRTFDSFEVKRRRLFKAIEADESTPAEAAALERDRLSPERLHLDPSTTAHLGPMVATPDVVNFNIGFFDFETTDLKANFGRILAFSVADQFGKVTSLRADDPALVGRSRRDDSRIAAAARDLLESFDLLVSWNGKRFDIRFLNGRLLLGNERPLRGDIMHVDGLPISRHYFAWHSHRLDAVQKTLRLENSKTGLDPDIWEAARDLEKWALDYVVEHCEADVLVLRDVFWRYRRVIKVVHR